MPQVRLPVAAAELEDVRGGKGRPSRLDVWVFVTDRRPRGSPARSVIRVPTLCWHCAFHLIAHFCS